MKKEIYVIWNETENRPAISRDNYGEMCVFLTLEQAQAYEAESKQSGIRINGDNVFSIRKFVIQQTNE